MGAWTWRTAAQVKEIIAGKAEISSVGLYGNPLMNEETAKDLGADDRCRRELFGTKLVCGFTGAVQGKPIPEGMATLKKVWEPLVKRARDKGVRIAFENCDMGGHWDWPLWNVAHAPAAWEMIFNELPFDNVGLEWEPCHQMVSLVEPLPQLRKWVGKIFHVHGKDATVAWDVLRVEGLRANKPWVWHRTPGFGDTNWTDVISILRQAKWRGAIDIEGWHDPVYRNEMEMTGQVHGLHYLKGCRGGEFVENPK